jgi:hypothetical protein
VCAEIKMIMVSFILFFVCSFVNGHITPDRLHSPSYPTTARGPSTHPPHQPATTIPCSVMASAAAAPRKNNRTWVLGP